MSPTPPPTLVHSVDELPPVDFSPAIERPTAQLVIVTTTADRDRLSLVLPDLCAVVWDTVHIDVDLSALQAREGRRAFVWLSREKTIDWLGFQLSEMGYAVNVIKKLAGVKHTTLMAQTGSEIQAWVKANMTAWAAPVFDEPVDVIPDPVIEQPPAPEPAAVMSHEQAADEMAALSRAKGIPAIGKRLRIDDWASMGLHISQGKPTPNVSNVSMLFDHIKPGEIWFDTFRQSIMTVDGPGRPSRRWTDADDIRLTIEVQRNCGMVKVAKGTVTDAVVEFAMRNLRNELKEYVLALEWDGVRRNDTAFEELFGLKRSAYSRDVSRNFFRSAVARAIWPGCKMDTMIVLEGEQGIGKSTVLEKLGGPWYSIMRDSPDSKDFAVVLAGKWIVEIAELDVFMRSSNASSKRALSTATDTYRPPYGKHSLDHPRSSIFAGSVNRRDWNRDATGARRYWPVDCVFAKPEIAERWRDQYFAEAFHTMVHDTKTGDVPDWWKFDKPDQVLAEQEARYMVDDWESSIEFYLRGKRKVAPNQIYDEVLKIDIKDRNHRTHGVRVADIMRRLGWESKSIYSKETGQKRFWINKETWTGG